MPNIPREVGIQFSFLVKSKCHRLPFTKGDERRILKLPFMPVNMRYLPRVPLPYPPNGANPYVIAFIGFR